MTATRDERLWDLLLPLSDADLCRLLDMLRAWEEMGSTVVAYTDEDGRWVDTEEPDAQ